MKNPVRIGLYCDTGKSNENYYNGGYIGVIGSIVGLYWDNGKGNYYFRV